MDSRDVLQLLAEIRDIQREHLEVARRVTQESLELSPPGRPAAGADRSLVPAGDRGRSIGTGRPRTLFGVDRPRLPLTGSATESNP